MAISSKKRKYIKRFASVKSAEQLAKETDLSVDTVLRVLKQLGYTVGVVPPEPAEPQHAETSFLYSLRYVILIIALVGTPLFYIAGLYDMYSLPKMVLLYVLYPAYIGTWVLDIYFRKRVSFYNCLRFPALPLLLFLAWAGLSLFWCVNIYSGILHLQKWLCMGVFFIGTLHLFKNTGQLRHVSGFITLVSCVVAGLGILQFFGINPEFLYQAAVPGSTFGNKNFVSQYIVTALPFSLYAAYGYRDRVISKIFSFSFFVSVFFLIISRTRGAWVASSAGLGIGCILFVIFLLKRKSELNISINIHKLMFNHVLPGVIFICVLLTASLMPSSNTVKSRKKVGLDIGQELRSITETKKGSAHWRLTAWKNTIYMIRSHPLLGVGLGNWQFYYPLYAQRGAVDKDFNEERQAKRAHNDYLQITAELGLPGIILFLWFIVNILFIGLRLLFIERDMSLALLGIVGVTSITSLMGHALFSFPLEESLLPFFLGVVGAMVVYGHLHASYKINRSFSFGSIPTILILIVCWVVFVVNVIMGYRFCWADYYFLQGKRYNKGKLFERSLHPLRRSLRLNPYNFRTYSLMGRSLNELKKYPESVEINRRALKLHPYYINCMNNLGNALRGVHKVDEAIEVYHKALKLFPNFAEAYNNLGIAYKVKRDIPKSKEAYLKAIDLDPSYSKAYNNLGNILLNSNQVDEAVKYYKKTIEIEPNLPDVYNNLGLALIKQGKYEKAIENFDKCIKLNSRLPDPHNNKGTALRKLKRYDDAIAQFTKAVQMNSMYLPAHNNLAETYLQTGKLQLVAEHYEAILKIDPNIKGIYQKLANVYMRLYKERNDDQWLDKAVELMKQAIGYYPHHANFYTVLGKIYMDSNQPELALEQFHKVLELTPEKAEAYYNLGVMYHNIKQYDKALSFYQHALLKNPDFIFLYFEMGKLFERLNKFDQSIKAYQTFLDKWTGDKKYSKRAEAKIENLKRK